tara:strand:- start:4598 stop:7150 length:2553 start_codon:yes stop_codon:yes gene_type:complete
MSNKGQDISTERIADYYTSLFHVLCSDVTSFPLNEVYDGAGNITGLSLSALNDRVVINNYIYPDGYGDPDGSGPEPIPDPTEWLDAFFPIGVIMLTTDNNNPTHRIAGTKWCRIDPPGQFLVGIGSSTDENGDVHRFAPHDQQPLNGDLAGEYRHRLTIDELPVHLHVTNAGTVVLGPVDNEVREEDTNVGFFYYFGGPVNEIGLVDENSPGGDFLGQDEIQAFQNNTVYNGRNKYRDWLVRHRFDYEDENGEFPDRLYTDEDFSPTLGSYPLAGWGPTVAGGPGWAGYLDNTKEFITNSPRPINIPWVLNGQDVFILQGFDTRDRDRVHPGTFTAQQLIRARDYIISVLGVEDATVALANVNRLKELNATVPQAVAGRTTVVAEIPATGHTESLNTGGTAAHNNVPPNYGVYAWRRVELDHTCGATEPAIGPLWKATITADKISTKDNPFNLNEWAEEHVNKDNLSWDGEQEAQITIADGVYIYSDDANDLKVPGMIIEDFPEGLTLINNGFIMGRGGNGGLYGADGQSGGDAIEITGDAGAITIENKNGGIGSGGGGGGGSNTGSGGGGGAGGGRGGGTNFTRGIDGVSGGAPGNPGSNGITHVGTISDDSLKRAYNAGKIVTDGWGPVYGMWPGIGGEAGGSGGGRSRQAGSAQGGNCKWRHNQNSRGTGGGGGRILTIDAIGGGTGGVPGSRYSGLQANGTTIKAGPPPGGNGPLGGHPGNYSPKVRGSFGHGNCRGDKWRNFGFRPSANNNNSITADAKGQISYFSITGWNGNFHYLTYVHGGYANTPGRNYNANGSWGGGGGGWGAAGGNGTGGQVGGQGGKAVQLTGSMSYTINGGIVYGSRD